MIETMLFQTGVMFCLIAGAGFLARWLDHPVLPYCLIAGMVSGPYVAGRLAVPGFGSIPHLDELELIRLLAEVGLILILFFTGLGLNLKTSAKQLTEIIDTKNIVFGLNFFLGLTAGLWFFGSWPIGFMIALIFGIPSREFLVVQSNNQLKTSDPLSEISVDALDFQKIIFVFFLVSFLVLWGRGERLIDPLFEIDPWAGYLVIGLLICYFILSLLVNFITTNHPIFWIIQNVAIGSGITGAILGLGIDGAISALFGGVVLSNLNGIAPVENLLHSLRNLFVPVFLFWLGMRANPLIFTELGGLLIGAVLLTLIGTFLGSYFTGILQELPSRDSFRLGTSLLPRGELALVIGSMAIFIPSLSSGTNLPIFTVGYVLALWILFTILRWLDGSLDDGPHKQ